MDLLTVRYFHLIDRATERLLNANAGDGHSGLTADDLKNQALVQQTYRKELAACTQSLLEEPMK